MDFSEMKVTERQQNAGPCSRFTVQEPEQKVIVRSGSMMAKVSLCLGVLLIALQKEPLYKRKVFLSYLYCT